MDATIKQHYRAVESAPKARLCCDKRFVCQASVVLFCWDDVRCHELQDVLTCSLVGEGVALGGRFKPISGYNKTVPHGSEVLGTARRSVRQRSVRPAGLSMGLKRTHC
jgi:hypothetical protein